MNLESLYPHAGNHSIQNAILAIEWGSEFSIAQLEKLRFSARSHLKDYPKEEPQQSIRVNFVAGQNAVPIPTPEITGYVFSRFSPNGEIQKQVHISRTNCLMIVSDYNRWGDLLDEASLLLSVIFPAINEDVLVAAAGLQYSDRFIWKSTSMSINFRDVFRVNSPFIAAHSLACSEPWHSHHGYFMSCDTPIPHTRLDNINVNVADEAEGRSIQILTSHRALFKTPIPATIQAITSVIDIENSMHMKNKEIFKQLLTDDLLTKINLTDRDHHPN